MNTWNLEAAGAVGRDESGAWHTASDWNACECGLDHRSEVEAEFNIRFDSGPLESWASLETNYARARTGASVSPQAWRAMRAEGQAALAAADAPREVWRISSEQVHPQTRMAVRTAMWRACAELGIREPMVSFFDPAGRGASLLGRALLSEHHIQIRADLDPGMAAMAVRHECKHLHLYLTGEDPHDEAACHAFSGWAP